MKNKTVLIQQAHDLMEKTLTACEKTATTDKCYKRLNALRVRAYERWERRTYETGFTGKEKSNAGRPRKIDKKIPVGVKLPPWLNEWMNRQPESKAVLIETALINYYQIPDNLHNN